MSRELFFMAILLWSVKDTCAKELTEAYCYSIHSCSKLLLIDVTIWFSDKMLFALTTLKNLENGVCRSEE